MLNKKSCQAAAFFYFFLEIKFIIKYIIVSNQPTGYGINNKRYQLLNFEFPKNPPKEEK